MAALRPVFASLLIAVLVVCGVVLPSVHRAAHAMEMQAERDEHEDAHHGDAEAHLAPEAAAMPLASAPCPPVPHDADCAVCGGLSAAADLAAAVDVDDSTDGDTLDAWAEWVKTQAAQGAGARAPPIS